MTSPEATREGRLTEEATALRETVKVQEITIKMFCEAFDLLVRRIFGKNSKALDEQQLRVLL